MLYLHTIPFYKGIVTLRSTNSTCHSDNSTTSTYGRSLREFEEQITSLKKENFNLKLRIYFLEEKNPLSLNTPEGTESLFKQNIDLKVRVL